MSQSVTTYFLQLKFFLQKQCRYSENHVPQLSFFILAVNIIEAVEPDEDDEDTEEEGDQSCHEYHINHHLDCDTLTKPLVK